MSVFVSREGEEYPKRRAAGDDEGGGKLLRCGQLGMVDLGYKSGDQDDDGEEGDDRQQTGAHEGMAVVAMVAEAGSHDDG